MTYLLDRGFPPKLMGVSYLPRAWPTAKLKNIFRHKKLFWIKLKSRQWPDLFLFPSKVLDGALIHDLATELDKKKYHCITRTVQLYLKYVHIVIVGPGVFFKPEIFSRTLQRVNVRISWCIFCWDIAGLVIWKMEIPDSSKLYFVGLFIIRF